MTVENSPAPAPPPDLCRVAIVEDHPEMRLQWTALLDGFDGFRCIHACGSGEEALECLPALAPGVVLMDIYLPRMSGIECTARLKQMLPATRVLIVTASDDEELVFPALEAGADGYLLKHSTPAQLQHSLLDLLQGGVPMTAGIARRVASFFRHRVDPRDRARGLGLSQRETEVLDLLSKGYGNKKIADRLTLSVETIRSYLKNIYDKMHVHTRSEAVARYITGDGHRAAGGPGASTHI
jgi:DNA-binding NarL/FixJ family response regulator